MQDSHILFRIIFMSNDREVHAVRYPEAWLDELRSRVDIADVIGGYVQLKSKGGRLWACCPFHNEKTASFSVDPERQMYYCFGCHKGGNVFRFMMDMDRMEFGDVVKELAERVHMELPKDLSGSRGPSLSKEKKDTLFEINRTAAHFYHDTLWQNDGAASLTYLHKRGLSDKDIRRFGLGSTANGRDACFRHLLKAGFDENDIITVGLAVKHETYISDFFQNRVMFPIIDGQGQVLGFGGRILEGNGPKYLNTGDTPIFNKRRNLYAMNFVRKERNIGKIILSEGYMDVIALRCAGMTGVVATLGTALTEEQARLMKRLAPEIWISYDGDGAGQKAALRALDIFEQMDINAKVIDYPDKMDPDEFVRAYGAEGFDKLKPFTAAEYRMLRVKDDLDMSDEQVRVGYAIKCCSILKKVKNPVEREGYLKKLEIETGFSRGVLLEQIGIVQSEQPVRRTVSGFIKPRVYTNVQKYERDMLTLISSGRIPPETCKPSDFSEGLYRDIAALLLEGVSPSSIPDRLTIDDEQLSEAISAMNIEMLPEDPEMALQYAHDALRNMRRCRQDELYESLLNEMQTCSDARRAEIREQLMKIESEKNSNT